MGAVARARPQERRAGRHTPRSLASTALADLDGPVRVQSRRPRPLRPGALGLLRRPSRTGSASPPSPASCRRPASRARRWSLPHALRPSRTRAEAPPGRSPPAVRRVCTSSCSRSAAAARPSRASSARSGSTPTGSSGRRPSGRCARSRSATACSRRRRRPADAQRRSSPRSPSPAGGEGQAALHPRLVGRARPARARRSRGRALRAGHAPGRACVPEAEGPDRRRRRRAADAPRARHPARRACSRSTGGRRRASGPAVSSRGARVATHVEALPRHSRTAGPGRRPRAASTAPASPCTCTARSASGSRTTRPCSTATGGPSRAGNLRAGDLVFFNGLGHVGIYLRRQQVHPRVELRRQCEDLEPERHLVRRPLRGRAPALALPAGVVLSRGARTPGSAMVPGAHACVQWPE